MTGIVEACFAGAQGPLVEGGQGTGNSGAEIEDLFAALLLALSCGLVSPEGQVQGELAAQLAEGDVIAAGIETIGSASALPAQVTAVSAEHGGVTGDLQVAEPPHPGTSEPVPVASTANEAGELPLAEGACSETSEIVPLASEPGEVPTDETAAQQPEAVPQSSTKFNFSSEPRANSPPVASAELKLFAEPDANSPPASSMEYKFFPEPDANGAPAESGKQVSALPEAEQLSPMPKLGSRSVPGAPQAEPKTSVFAEQTVDSQSHAQSSEFSETTETESQQSGGAHAQAQSKPVSQERVLAVTQRETQQNGDDLARGQSEKPLPETLVHSQAARVQHVANTTASNLARVSDVGEAQLTQSVIDQTVKSVLLSVQNGSSELRVRLKPDHLGELHLRLVFKDNVLHLDVNTQSTVVKSIIESNLGQLRQSLDNSGVDTGRLSITVKPDLSPGGHSSREAYAFQPSQDEWSDTYRGRHAGEEPPLEGVPRSARMRYATSLIDLVA